MLNKPPSHDLARKKVHAGISALAWVSSENFKVSPQNLCSGDYIQSMIVLESLAEKNGFDHADLVARYRADRPTRINGSLIGKNGEYHVGQIRRLREDANKLYRSSTGFTSGCAMKTLGLGVWNREYHSTVFMADSVTRVTHGTDEARLIGLLAALRYRHAMLDIDDASRLISDWTAAAKMLCIHGTAAWHCVDSAVQIAAGIVRESWGTEALRRLMRRVGMMSLAWSCPVSAIFWSYNLDPAIKRSFTSVGGDGMLRVEGEQVPIDKDVNDRYSSYLWINHADGKAYLDDIGRSGRHGFCTFFSLAFSIAAVRSHDFLDASEAYTAFSDIGRENWSPTLDAIEVRWR